MSAPSPSKAKPATKPSSSASAVHTAGSRTDIQSRAASKKEKEKVKMAPGPFGQRIELPVVKPTKHKCELYPDGFLAFEIIGTSGCGKSRLMLSIVPNIGGIKSVVVCSLVPGNEVYKQLKLWCESEGANFALASGLDEAADAIEHAINDVDYGEDESGIVIFDDFSGQQGSRDAYGRIADQASSTVRNGHQHVMFITQAAQNVPMRFRNNANVRIIFPMNDTHAVYNIRRDVLTNMPNLDPDDFRELYNRVRADDVHSYVMLTAKGNQTLLSAHMNSTDGPDAPPKPVQFIDPLDLAEDTRMQRLVTRYKESLPERGAPARRESSSLRRMIEEHASTIARTERRSLDSILDEIEEIFDVRLR